MATFQSAGCVCAFNWIHSYKSCGRVLKVNNTTESLSLRVIVGEIAVAALSHEGGTKERDLNSWMHLRLAIYTQLSGQEGANQQLQIIATARFPVPSTISLV
jgi:hypothetical protein